MEPDPEPGRTGVDTFRGESHFRRLLDRLPAGAYTCDPRGLITYYNRQAVELWGRAPKLNDPVDRFCGSFRLFATDGAPLAHEQCWMALALRQNREFNGQEIVVERPDGDRRHVLAHANPVRDDEGRLLGAVNVLVDITRQKEVEAALREIDRSKNRFMATLAHELRNPLAPIRHAVEILHLRGGADEESRWAADVIERQTRQLTRLVDDLLDVARITGDKLELRPERLDLGDVITAATETCRPLLDASGHELTLRTPSEPLPLDGDFARLTQVVANLLNNAIKYTPPGGHVEVAAERRGDEAVVAVRDDGAGIDADLLPHVFEMFRQGGPALGGEGGLGIGLTLVQRLVGMHGGRVVARSRGAGRGSEFVVYLPVAEGAASEAPADRAPVPDAEPDGGRPRVLVVDDNRDAAAALVLLLRVHGHEVAEAHAGGDALRVARAFRPDVVLLDLGLPDLDGYEVARRLRGEPSGGELALVAVSGWGQDEDRRRSAEAGFDRHLVKPVEPALLERVLAEVSGSTDRLPSR